MSKINDLSKYETSDFTPSWLDLEFPNSEEYEEIKDVIKFYLINTPWPHSSSRGTDITMWGPPFKILMDKLKSEIGLEKGKNFDYCNSGPRLKELFSKYALCTDFTSVASNTVVFLATDNTVYERLFLHIRNSIAHSR
jgi:hypothetical protein